MIFSAPKNEENGSNQQNTFVKWNGTLSSSKQPAHTKQAFQTVRIADDSGQSNELGFNTA